MSSALTDAAARRHRTSVRPCRAMNAADRVFELCDADQLLRRQRSHRNHQLRLEHRDLAVEMRAASRDLFFIGNAITAALHVLSGKTANHRRDMNPLAERC